MSTFRRPVILAATVLLLAVGLPLVPAAASEPSSGAAVPARKLTTSQLAAKMLTAGEVRAATGLTEFQSFSTPACDELTVSGAPVAYCSAYGAYSGTFPDSLARVGNSSVESWRTSKEGKSRFAQEAKNYAKLAKANGGAVLVSKPELLIYQYVNAGLPITGVISVMGSSLVSTSCSRGTDASRRSCATKMNKAQSSKLSGATLATTAAPPAPAPADGSDPSQSPDSGGTPEVTNSEFSPGGF